MKTHSTEKLLMKHYLKKKIVMELEYKVKDGIN